MESTVWVKKSTTLSKAAQKKHFWYQIYPHLMSLCIKTTNLTRTTGLMM